MLLINIAIIKDVKKVAKLADPYTEIKELYKNLKTNQTPKFFIKNLLSGHFPK